MELGGGIRSVGDAGHWLDIGVDRVILGTLATKQPEAIAEIAKEYGSERVVAGVDAKGGQVVVNGWEDAVGDYISWAKRFEELGAGALLFTNVDVEGLQSGIRSEPVKRLIESVSIPVIAAGGISSTADVKTLKSLGTEGIVLGSSLYSGKISLTEVLEVCR